MKACVVWVLGLWILYLTTVNSQSQSGRTLFPPCSLVNRRVIDNIYDRAYQRGYEDTFQSTVASSKAYYIKVQCLTDTCGPDARAKAEEEAREQADANRQAAIEQATEETLELWKSDLDKCLPIIVIEDCDDMPGCTYVNSVEKCVPTSIAT